MHGDGRTSQIAGDKVLIAGKEESIADKNGNIKKDLLQKLLQDSPEKFTSRLMCARHLEATTRYVAFVVPVFESGRAAGRGLPLDKASSDFAWDKSSNNDIDLPYYYKWEFITSQVGDFESLINELKPSTSKAWG
jgi:hypothetical protein